MHTNGLGRPLLCTDLWFALMSWQIHGQPLLAANTYLVCTLGGARSLRGAIHSDTCGIFTAHAGLQYAYMEDLWQLDRSPGPIPWVWLRSQVPKASPTSLLASVWQAALRYYPDPRLHNFLVQGLREGFRIGYTAPRVQLRPAKRNIPSSYEHPDVVDKYLAHECKLGWVPGPWHTPPPLQRLHAMLAVWHDRKVCVLRSVSQVALPSTSIVPVEALYLQTLHPLLITLVTHTVQLISTCWAVCLVLNTPLAEEVATTGQNWFKHKL